MSTLKSLIAAAALAAALPAAASAAVVSYVGQDIMSSTGDAHPTSAAAAASFAAATPGATVVDFESAPVASFSSLTIAPGVTLTGSDLNGNDQSIRDTTDFPPAPTLDGYNTTAGGANFVEMFGGSLTFTFAKPIDAFGAYISGVQTAFFADAINFSDGSSQTVLIPGAGTSSSVGALSFVGFTDFGKSITSITILAGGPFGADAIGVDDVRFAAVPEAGTWMLMLAGIGVLGAAMRRRRAGAFAA